MHFGGLIIILSLIIILLLLIVKWQKEKLCCWYGKRCPKEPLEVTMINKQPDSIKKVVSEISEKKSSNKKEIPKTLSYINLED